MYATCLAEHECSDRIPSTVPHLYRFCSPLRSSRCSCMIRLKFKLSYTPTSQITSLRAGDMILLNQYLTFSRVSFLSKPQILFKLIWVWVCLFILLLWEATKKKRENFSGHAARGAHVHWNVSLSSNRMDVRTIWHMHPPCLHIYEFAYWVHGIWASFFL